jgi:hypothetical protein
MKGLTVASVTQKRGVNKVLKTTKLTFAAFSVLVIAGPVAAAKKPKPVDQDPITRGCVIVDEIRFQGLSLTHAPGMQGIVHNNCNTAAGVVATAAFFDSRGNQLDSGGTYQTIASGASWSFFIPVPGQFLHGFICDVKAAQIIEVSAGAR